MTSLLPESPSGHPPAVHAPNLDQAITIRQQTETSVTALATALLTALTAATGHPTLHLPDAPPLAGYGARVMDLALAGLEPTTRGAYLAAWHRRLLPELGTVPIDRITPGAIDRAVHGWARAGHQQSAIKNTLAMLARITRQAVRDGWLPHPPQALKGWQRLYLDTDGNTAEEPRGLALPDFTTLRRLADALTDASHDRYPGWGQAVIFAACTGARIGEVSGVRVGDIHTQRWLWHARRQTTPAPGGLTDKRTKGKRARLIPVIEPLRPLITARIAAAQAAPDARLFTGPARGRITTAGLRRATHWDDVTRSLGLPHLRRLDLRHTALTWMADAGIPLHVLQQIAGHRSITTTQRYLHPSIRHLTTAGQTLTDYVNGNCRPIPGTPQRW
ncbi:tyrosine-type recombinase/integrase [Streptomyces sp. NPDC102381]|uniref:tyrosine-type recombinase/integrase n=1 Tax=Streptomyces sp. NPDC102381 TaxID=3366164 RepID=UPI003802A305